MEHCSPGSRIEVITLKKIVRRIPWGTERQLRLSLWDLTNNPPRLAAQAESFRCLLKSELHAMVIDEGRPRSSSFVPFGRTQAGHLKTADSRHAWKHQALPSPLQAHQMEVDGKGKGKDRGGKGKLTRQNSQCHNCGEIGHWRPECPKPQVWKSPTSTTPGPRRARARARVRAKGKGKPLGKSSDRPVKGKGKGKSKSKSRPSAKPCDADGEESEEEVWDEGPEEEYEEYEEPEEEEEEYPEEAAEIERTSTRAGRSVSARDMDSTSHLTPSTAGQ